MTTPAFCTPLTFTGSPQDALHETYGLKEPSMPLPLDRLCLKPWAVRLNSPTSIHANGGHSIFTADYPHTPICSIRVTDGSLGAKPSEDWANLIAAAPELLAALRTLENHIRRTVVHKDGACSVEMDFKSEDEARAAKVASQAAIAKAEGRS